MRHPIYFGLIFAAFVTAIEKGTSFALFGAAILTFAFYTKARREERFLRVELSEGAYDAYARKTAMLVPFKGLGQNIRKSLKRTAKFSTRKMKFLS